MSKVDPLSSNQHVCPTPLHPELCPVCNPERDLLGELLAVVHRDGGHYQDNHGTTKAVSDGMDVVYQDRTELDRRRDQILNLFTVIDRIKSECVIARCQGSLIEFADKLLTIAREHDYQI